VIAHRGASGYAPENTAAAYLRAVELGAKAVETDVHQTRDGVIVTLHDETLDRTTNGEGAVSTWDWADVLTLDAGSWFHKDFANERVPDLQSFLDCLGDRAVPVIELKGGKDIEERLARRFGLSQGGAFFFSFGAKRIEKMKSLCPGCPCLYLAHWTKEPVPCDLAEVSLAVEMGVDAIGVDWRRLSKDFVETAHDKELAVFVYTVNESPALSHCLDCNVDAVISDVPDQIEDWLGEGGR